MYVGWPRTAMVMLGETLWVVCVVDTPAKLVAGIASLYDLRGMGAVGMLFIFGGNLTWCFWMRDTPLRIVWISGSRAAQEALAQPLNAAPYAAYGDELEPTMPPWLADGRGVASSPQPAVARCKRRRASTRPTVFDELINGAMPPSEALGIEPGQIWGLGRGDYKTRLVIDRPWKRDAIAEAPL